MKKGNVTKYRFSSTLLASTLIASALVSAPASFGADEAVSNLNTVTYKLTSTIDTIFIDLAEEYAYQIVYVDVKKKVRENGRMVLRYVNVDIVVLDESARATTKTRVGIKLGDIIRVSMAGYPDNVPVKWQLIK